MVGLVGETISLGAAASINTEAHTSRAYSHVREAIALRNPNLQLRKTACCSIKDPAQPKIYGIKEYESKHICCIIFVYNTEVFQHCNQLLQ